MTSPACPICWEVDSTNTVFPFRQCSHVVCRNCLVPWIETVEASGDTASPRCPSCNTELTREETQEILGRPFIPATKAPAEMDEFTRHLLEETCKQCPRCGVWIEKQDGDDNMECLCGCQFCYGCGAERGAAVCRCNSSRENTLVQQHPKQQKRSQHKRETTTVHPIIFGASWLFAAPNSRDITLQILSLQIEMAMRDKKEYTDDNSTKYNTYQDEVMVRQCPVCETWTTKQPLSNGQHQIIGMINTDASSPHSLPDALSAKVDGDVCQCSCGTRFCFQCAIINPRTCRHGKHCCSDPLPTDIFSKAYCCNVCAINHERALQYLEIYESSVVQTLLRAENRKTRKWNKTKTYHSTQCTGRHDDREPRKWNKFNRYHSTQCTGKHTNRRKAKWLRRPKIRENYELSLHDENRVEYTSLLG